MSSNNLFIGNIVSFVDTEYFVELITIKENAKLYKIEKGFIDVTDIDEESIIQYVEEIENKKGEILTVLPVYKKFIDERSLISYKKTIKQLIR